MSATARPEPRELAFPQAVIGWATLVVVLLSVLALGSNRPVSWTLLSMAVLPLFVLQIALDLFRGIPSNAARIWPIALLYIGVLVWGYIQTLTGVPVALEHPAWQLVPDAPPSISAEPLAGQHHVMRLATYAMVFWIAIRSAANVDRGLLFMKAFALFSTGLAAFGIYAWATGENIILLEDASNTVSASFINRNSYATYAVFGAIANLAIYLHMTDEGLPDDGHGGRRIRNFLESFFSGGWLFALGVLLCFGALLLTQSRAGAAAGIVALVSFMAIHRRRDGGRNPLIIASLAAILLFVILSLSSGLTSRLLATSEEDGRFAIYPQVVEGIADRPILGHGLGGFHDSFRAYVPLEVADVEWDLAHSSYLENAYELGLPAAFAFYLALFGIAVVLLRGAITRRRHRLFSCVAFSCLVAGGFHSVFDFSLQMPATAATFAFLLGLGWTQSFRRPRRYAN